MPQGLLRELNPGPLAPEARMPLDQAANMELPRKSHVPLSQAVGGKMKRLRRERLSICVRISVATSYEIANSSLPTDNGVMWMKA